MGWWDSGVHSWRAVLVGSDYWSRLALGCWMLRCRWRWIDAEEWILQLREKGCRWYRKREFGVHWGRGRQWCFVLEKRHYWNHLLMDFWVVALPFSVLRTLSWCRSSVLRTSTHTLEASPWLLLPSPHPWTLQTQLEALLWRTFWPLQSLDSCWTVVQSPPRCAAAPGWPQTR